MEHRTVARTSTTGPIQSQTPRRRRRHRLPLLSYLSGNVSFRRNTITTTCMNCHKQIWAESPYLEPVRASFRTGTPIEWLRVHDLPDYAYFNHSIHVNKGVGCSTCHGRVDQMPITYQAASLQMEWCLECHRNPERFVRPKDKVFEMEWRAENRSREELSQGRTWLGEYHIQPPNVLTSCSTCHR